MLLLVVTAVLTLSEIVSIQESANSVYVNIFEDDKCSKCLLAAFTYSLNLFFKTRGNFVMPPPLGRGIKQCCLTSDVRLSDVCLFVAYRPKSRTERPRKIKIGTEVAQVIPDSDTTFKVKRSKVKVKRGRGICGGLPHSLLMLNMRCKLSHLLQCGFQFRNCCWLRMKLLGKLRARSADMISPEI